MDEKKLINIDKIKTYIFLYIFAFGTTTGFIGMLLTAELENHLTYGFTILFFLAGLLVFPICLKYEKRFNGNRLGCKVYSFNHISYEELLQKVYDYAMKNEYINKEELITNRDEKFTLYFKNNPEFLEYPKYKSKYISLKLSNKFLALKGIIQITFLLYFFKSFTSTFLSL